MPNSIETIVQSIDAERIGNIPATINWLLTDSRSLCFPEATLFFALITKRNDGHKYILDLYKKGVRNFVVSTLPEDMEHYAEANFLLVKDTLKALQKLAVQHRELYDVPVVGVTGSNGKTVVKEWLYQLLSPDRIVARSPRSYNSQIGVPLSVWLMNENTELGIFEAGISEMGEMEALIPMIRPTIGVLTNIRGAHQENFYSMQEKCMEKLSLFTQCDVLIYNGDNPLIQDCVSKSIFAPQEIAWSTKDKEKPLYIDSIDKRERETVITYRYLGLLNSYTIPFIDDASVENSLHCLAVALYLMIPTDIIAERMKKLEPIAMRLEVKEGKNNCLIINDSYNSDYASLDIALDFMQRRADEKWHKRTLILSDILETGQSNKLLYRQVAELIQNRGIEKFIGVGEALQEVAHRFDMEKYFFRTTSELLESGILSTLRNEVVLIKGARVFRFDKVSDVLELKVHETILEINLNSLVDNLNHYRNALQSGTKMICMVKASAYGTGAFEVAKTLEEHRVDYLAVAVADEGAALRKAGVNCPIIVMNPEHTAFHTLFEYKLEPEVYSFHLLDALIHAAAHEGVSNYPIHVKIDTGMHRLGFGVEEVPTLIERLQRQTAVISRSIFSHFVGSDSPLFDDFTREQIRRFEQASELFQSSFSYKILKHICNSAGIIRFPEAHYDMVRLGIGLYGVDPIENRMLQTVVTLKSTILQIRKIPANETVGYSRNGKFSRDARVAAIPIGYADGLNRKLGNRHAYCLINGKAAPYVGNICMDVCLVDVTDIDCKEGDEVIIFGKELPITYLAEILDTIPYEVLTSISERVKRVYYQD